MLQIAYKLAKGRCVTTSYPSVSSPCISTMQIRDMDIFLSTQSVELDTLSGKDCSHSTSTSLHPIHHQFLHLYISTCICRMWVFFFLHQVLSWVLFLEGIVIVVQVLPLVDILDSNEKDLCLAINIIPYTLQVLLLFPLPGIIIITFSLNISKL